MTKRLFTMFLIISLGAGILFPVECFAGKDLSLWISPSGELTIDAIRYTSIKSGDKYLFLPGNLNLENALIGFDADEVSINGTQVISGQTAASVLIMDQPNKIEYKNGRATGKIIVTPMQGSVLPSVYITTESGSLRYIQRDKANKEPGFMILYDADGKQIYNGALKHFKMRGNASTKYVKKNYAVKLQNGKNLLGMGKAKKWVLIGNYLDKSLIRAQMTFAMARYAGLQYTPDCQQVSLYVNNDFLGTYLLMEKLEIDDDRVNIRDLGKETEEMNDQDLSSFPIAGSRHYQPGNYKGYQIPNEPEDCSGGYIIEYEHLGERYAENPSAYYTKRIMCLIIHEPEYCTEKQIKYIAKLMQGFENAIFAEDGNDPETGKHYSEFVDFESLVNKYLVNEVSKNYDANMASEYFYKPDDSVSTKAFAGPVWDLDNTWGTYSRADNRKSLNPASMTAAKGGTQAYWWPALYKQKDFLQAVKERYHETFVPALEILLGKREETEVLKSMDTYAAAIEKNVAMDYVRYPNLTYEKNGIQTGRNLKENIDYLKNYITKRMEYLSQEWKIEKTDN